MWKLCQSVWCAKSCSNGEMIEIHRCLKAIYGNGCMHVKNAHQWVWCDKSSSKGEMSMFDEQWSGWPMTNFSDVWHESMQSGVMIHKNRLIKQRNIALTLKYRKIYTRWISWQLMDSMKECRKLIFKNFQVNIIAKQMISSWILSL